MKKLRIDQIKQRGGAVPGLGVLPTSSPLSVNPQLDIPQFSTHGFDSGQLESIRALNQIAQAEAREYQKALLAQQEEQALLDLNTKFNISVHNPQQQAELDALADKYNIDSADWEATKVGNAYAVKDFENRLRRATNDPTFLRIAGEVDVANKLRNTAMTSGLLNQQEYSEWLTEWDKYQKRAAGERGAYDVGLFAPSRFRIPKGQEQGLQLDIPAKDAEFVAQYIAAGGDPNDQQAIAQAYVGYKQTAPSTGDYLEQYFGDNPTNQEMQILTAARKAAREGQIDPNNPDEVLSYIDQQYTKLAKSKSSGSSGGGLTAAEKTLNRKVDAYIRENDLEDTPEVRQEVMDDFILGNIRTDKKEGKTGAFMPGQSLAAQRGNTLASNLQALGVDPEDFRFDIEAYAALDPEDNSKELRNVLASAWPEMQINDLKDFNKLATLLGVTPAPAEKPGLTKFKRTTLLRLEQALAGNSAGIPIQISDEEASDLYDSIYGGAVEPQGVPTPTAPAPAVQDTPRIDLRGFLQK